MSVSFNIGNILSREETDKNDYFRILGCSENSTEEQIVTEYRIRALKCHPDKNPGNEEAIKEFQKLQEARDVLTDPESRRMFDKWRHSEMCIPFKSWINMNNRCAPTMHWAKPKTQTMLEAGSSHSKYSEVESAGVNEPEESFPTVGRNAKGWESDSSAGVYNQFRNYKI